MKKLYFKTKIKPLQFLIYIGSKQNRETGTWLLYLGPWSDLKTCLSLLASRKKATTDRKIHRNFVNITLLVLEEEEEGGDGNIYRTLQIPPHLLVVRK